MDVLGLIKISSSSAQWCETLGRALEYAVLNNETVAISGLMDHVAKSTLDKEYIAQVLCAAIQCGNFPSFSKTLECACIGDGDRAFYMNWKNGDGKQMIHVAAVHDRPASIRFLLAKGCDVNAKDSDGKTPLFLALKHWRLKSMNTILDARPNLDLQYENSKSTVMHVAAQRGIPGTEYLEALVRAGAKADCTDYKMQTPLHFASGVAFSAMGIRMIIDSGGDVNARKRAGNTPLHSACRHVKPIAVELLLRHGAMESLVNRSGRTAAQVIGLHVSPQDRSAVDVGRIVHLLENAPLDRAWFRRAPVVMCHERYVRRPGVPKTRWQPKRLCARLKRTNWEEALHFLFSEDMAPEIFRAVVGYLW